MRALFHAASSPLWKELCARGSSKCGKAPSPRAYHSAVMLRSKMFVFGGGEWMSNDLWMLDLEDMKKPRWTALKPGVCGGVGVGCIGREGTSEAAPGAVRLAVAGGCQSGWGRLLTVTNAI